MTEWLVAAASWFAVLLGPADQHPACLVLGGLDLVRAQALADRDPRRLADVYADAGLRRHDEELVRRYAARGLAVRGAGLQRLSCRAVPGGDGRLVLEVVDRLGPSVAVDATGERVALPVDEPTRRRVTLVRVGDAWRVARSR